MFRMFNNVALDLSTYKICAICSHQITNENDLIIPCQCKMECHKQCFDRLLYTNLDCLDECKRKSPKLWFIWLFNRKLYDNITKPKFLTPKFNKSVHDKKSFIIGFVNQRFTFNNSIILNLKIFYNGVNDFTSILCPNCSQSIKLYGKKSKIYSITNKIIKNLKYASLITTTSISLIFTTLISLFCTAGIFTFILSWQDDFFKKSYNYETEELIRFLFIPHYVLTMSTPNIGLINLIICCIYSYFDYGIPINGITNYLKKFIYLKFLFTLIYRLTLNRYYFESIKNTIPALFGFKLKYLDAWSIQDYRNRTIPEEYDNLSIWEKFKIIIKETWYCLYEDFGELYRQTNWDFIFNNYGFSCSFIGGILIGNSFLMKNLLNNLYFTDLQNDAYCKFIGIVTIQIFYFIISTFDSCALVQCYNNLQPGEGFIPWSRIYYLVKYTYLKLATNPLDFF